MKIVHHTARFLPISQTFIKDLLDALPEYSLKCQVITHELISDISVPDVEVTDVSLNRYNKWIKKIINLFNRLRGLAHNTDYQKSFSLIKSQSPDVIHCHFGTAAYLNYFIQKHARSEIPVLLSFHGFDVFKANSLFPGYIKTIKKISNGNCLFTCPSEFLKTTIVEKFDIPAEKIVVIPNGFNQNLFSPSAQLYKPSKMFKIVHVGRFVDFKGQKYLIEMMRLLKDKGVDNVLLTLIGDGANKVDMESLARELEVSQRINFAGAMQHNDVAKLLQESHLYVHPSCTLDDGTAETFGVAILEALACGKPVVITDSGGMTEILPNGDTPFVKVVEQKSAIALASAVLYFIDELPKMNDKEFIKYQQLVLDKNNLSRSSNMVIECYKKLHSDV